MAVKTKMMNDDDYLQTCIGDLFGHQQKQCPLLSVCFLFVKWIQLQFSGVYEAVVPFFHVLPFFPFVFLCLCVKYASNYFFPQVTWRGSPLSSLPTLNVNNVCLPPVHLSPDHTVLLRLSLLASGTLAPHPSSYTDIWDQYHVRMPCSPMSQYPLGGVSWGIVLTVVLREISSKFKYFLFAVRMC